MSTFSSCHRHRPGVFRHRLLALLTASTLMAALPTVTQAQSQDHGPGIATELVVRALGLLGVQYKRGGNSPDTGLDCSGLVKLVFQEAAGLVLPRQADEMSRNGTPIERSELKPGDLVFFNTLRRTFSHVGIYIGDGRFVHAPSSGGKVRIEALTGSYWASRFTGARRLLASEESNVAMQLSTAGIGASSLSLLQSSLHRARLTPARGDAQAGRANGAASDSPQSVFESAY